MTTPISSSSPPQPPAPASTALPPAPLGIGSTQGSLSSAAPSPPGSHWETIKRYASSFGEFVRDLIARAIEGIRSGLGVVAGWLGKAGPAVEETPDGWEIPATTMAPGTQAAPSGGASSPATPDPFSLLPISDPEKQKIHTLIHAMGSWSWWRLLTNKTRIEQIGQEINEVHPLKFLDYIFRHPTLPKSVEAFSASTLIWNPFVEGVREKMRREAATLPACVAGFAKSLNIHLADIEPYFAGCEWEDLVRFLIAVKTGKRTSVWVEPVTATPPVSEAASTSGSALPASASTAAHIASPSSSATPPVRPPPATQALPVPPPAQPQLADLPFNEEHRQALRLLIAAHAEHNLIWRGTHRTDLEQRWTRLRECHPLKLLAEIYSNLQTIQPDRINGSLRSALKSEQLSRMSIAQILPHVDAFATHCHLDAQRTRTLIQGGHWKELVKDLVQSYREQQQAGS